MIKAIETIYNGYRFRSRLEARWAVFFDEAGIKYEYENEGYETEDYSIKYLPDFYLPDFDTHVEVKPDTKDGRIEIITKCEDCVTWGGPIKQLLVLSKIPLGRSTDGGLPHYPVLYWCGTQKEWGWYYFCCCGEEVEGRLSHADYISPRYKNCQEDGQFSLLACSDTDLRPRIQRNEIKKNIEVHIRAQEAINDRVFLALRRARIARFEFGETIDRKPEE